MAVDWSIAVRTASRKTDTYSDRGVLIATFALHLIRLRNAIYIVHALAATQASGSDILIVVVHT